MLLMPLCESLFIFPKTLVAHKNTERMIFAPVEICHQACGGCPGSVSRGVIPDLESLAFPDQE